MKKTFVLILLVVGIASSLVADEGCRCGNKSLVRGELPHPDKGILY